MHWPYQGRIHIFWKESALYVVHHGWVSDGLKSRNNFRKYKFWAKCSISTLKFFQFFLIKSYQFFKIYQRFDKEIEKTLIEQSMGKKKLRKVEFCFIIGCFIKPYKMIINFFFFFFLSQADLQCNFCFFISAISKGETGNNK